MKVLSLIKDIAVKMVLMENLISLNVQTELISSMENVYKIALMVTIKQFCKKEIFAVPVILVVGFVVAQALRLVQLAGVSLPCLTDSF